MGIAEVDQTVTLKDNSGTLPDPSRGSASHATDVNQALDNAERDYDKAYDSYGSRCLHDQEPSLPHEESPPDVNKLQTTAPLNHTGMLPDTDADAGEFNNSDLQHAPDDALQTLPGTAPELSPALPEHDIRTFLQPVPPGSKDKGSVLDYTPPPTSLSLPTTHHDRLHMRKEATQALPAGKTPGM